MNKPSYLLNFITHNNVSHKISKMWNILEQKLMSYVKNNIFSKQILKSYEIITKIIFVSITKIGRRKHNEHFKVLFFRAHLTHQTYYLHTQKKSNSHNQYSFGLMFSWNLKKSNTDQVYFKFFHSIWKETTLKRSKVGLFNSHFLALLETSN